METNKYPQDSVINDFETLLKTGKPGRSLRKYELTADEMKLIAQLLHIRPNGLLCDKAADIVSPSDNTVNTIITGLKYKGFVRLGITSTGKSYVALTAAAMEAINRNEPLPADVRIDFVEKLRSADAIGMRDAGWLKEFKSEVSLVSTPFTRAWDKLGINDLSEEHALAFCAALKYFIMRFTEPFDGHVAENDDEKSRIKLVSSKKLDGLVQKGLMIAVGNGYVISPDVAESLLYGHDEIVNYKDISSYTQIIKGNNIEKKVLFFSSESQEEIDHLNHMLSKDGYDYACSVLAQKKRNPAIISLLWGGPGTGKTETVKQIAQETERDIFLFDVAKVTASDWGATENLYRGLFRAYRYIVAVKSLTPILLFNEADQVLSRRLTNIVRSIDKSENIVSNILLQEFEDLHGILLATTNHIALLDNAFDRRFLFKTELQKPDAKARKSIWMSMIPELAEHEAETLAQNYEMSGAQINNVATKRDLAELYFHGDRGLAYIQGLCEKEISVVSKNSAIKKIGF